MAYRSDLEAALARLDAMQPQAPCPSCAARSKRLRRVGRFTLALVISMAAFVLLIFGSVAGFIAACAVLATTVFLLGRAPGSGTSTLVALGFGLLSAAALCGFYYLERLLSFDVGRFG